MKQLFTSLLALTLCLSAFLVHASHEDKDPPGQFHFGPVTNGDGDQEKKEEV